MPEEASEYGYANAGGAAFDPVLEYVACGSPLFHIPDFE